MAKRKLKQQSYGNGSSKKKKTIHFSADFEPAYLIDLTKPGNPESLIIKPRRKVPIVDLNGDESSEDYVTVPEETVDFVDLTTSSPEPETPEEEPEQREAPKSSKKSTRNSKTHSSTATPSKPASGSKTLSPFEFRIPDSPPLPPQDTSFTFKASSPPPNYDIWKPWISGGPQFPIPSIYPVLPDLPSAPTQQKASGTAQAPVVKPVAEPARKAADPSPSTLSELGLSVALWKKLEDTTRRTLPRFLFRGFHSSSGGGFDRRLNTVDGVIPHGFIDLHKKPTNIYDIPNLKEMIRGHLCGHHVLTQFSSWSSSFNVARRYARDLPCAHIAILDTSIAEEHVRAYHVPSLRAATLTGCNGQEEYLVYGPVRGVAFHCVPWKSLSGAIETLSRLPVRGGMFFYKSHADMEQEVLLDKVRLAKATATLFRRPLDTRPDIIIAVTVALCYIYKSGRIEAEDASDDALLEGVMSGLKDEIGTLQLPGKHTGAVGLVNRRTYTHDLPPVKHMRRLLGALEKRVRSERTSRRRAQGKEGQEH